MLGHENQITFVFENKKKIDIYIKIHLKSN